MAKKLTKEFTDSSIVITFANGIALTVDFAQLSEDIKLQLMKHGLSQKLGDASAGTETVEEAISETQKVADRLIAGDWKSIREGSGAPKIGLLVEALARVTQKDVDDCRAVVEQLDDEQKKKLRAHPGVKAAMADIRAERERAKLGDGGGEGFNLNSIFG